jgi:hypothetical protein
LELTVLGFDPIIMIIFPSWGDCADIFNCAQCYLLYFCLQAKMNFHYDDCTRSGIFLRAIQQSDYANTVMTIQLHVNSYHEQYDDGCLTPPLPPWPRRENPPKCSSQATGNDCPSPLMHRRELMPRPGCPNSQSRWQ